MPLSAPLVRISTQGSVSVQGEARKDIAYTLTRRTKIREAEPARKILEKIGLKARRQGAWLVLSVELPVDAPAAADLELRVPRKLRELKVQSDFGAVEAVDLDGAVGADTGVGRVRLDRVKGDVVIHTSGGQVRLGKIEGAVKCYSGAGAIMADWIGGRADLNTGGGQIQVVSARGPVRATAQGGNIRVERSELGVTANAGAGLIDVLGVDGPVNAETGNGSIKVRSAGNVTVRSAAGAIRLYSVWGALRASTGQGSIVAELAGGKTLIDSALSTAAGDITVYIPSNLPVTVQAVNTTPGRQRILSDFDEIRSQADSGPRALAQGELAGGGPLLKLTASGGTIYLRRKE